MMLILVGFQLDSSIWMLDVSPIPGVDDRHVGTGLRLGLVLILFCCCFFLLVWRVEWALRPL